MADFCRKVYNFFNPTVPAEQPMDTCQKNEQWFDTEESALKEHYETRLEKDATERYEDSSHSLNVHCSMPRLLVPGCGGIRERIDLFSQLINSGKDAWLPDVYDETALIIAAIERNARLQEGPDGECLLALTTAAVSNRNIDLNRLDAEIERQFGLHSVEVTGDGACAFRAAIISGLAKPDLYHLAVRKLVLEEVLKHPDYYSTVFRPGEKVSVEELEQWKQTMSDPNTYADEMAMIGMANAYHFQLVIFRAGDLLHVIDPHDGVVRHTAFLVNVGTHYKALVTRPELDQARRNSERFAKS